MHKSVFVYNRSFRQFIFIIILISTIYDLLLIMIRLEHLL